MSDRLRVLEQPLGGTLSAGQAAPSADTAMFFFETERLRFSPEFLGRIQLCQGLAELLGATPAALPPRMPSSQRVLMQSASHAMQHSSKGCRTLSGIVISIFRHPDRVQE